MSNWNQKYKYDLPSTFASSKEINPLYLHYVLSSKGFACPDFKEGNTLFIGCGNGLSLSMHTACNSSHWKGIEFNPVSVNSAKRRAKQCHIAIDLCADDLEALAQRDDLPKFDLICVPAVWSWIAKEDQERLIDIISKHLNDGGVLFMSYNCTVGMINYESVRELLKLYDTTHHIDSLNDQERMMSLSKFLFPVVEKNAIFVCSQPDFSDRLIEANHNPKPFLSESLNTYWSMDHFSEVSKRLERADVGYVCSANSIDNLDNINLTKEQRDFLEPLLGTNLYEETRDFMVNQRSRFDIYIKGAVPLNPNEYLAEVSSHFITLMIDISGFDYVLEGNQGPVELDKSIYEPLLAILSDNSPKNIGAMIDAMLQHNAELNITDIIEAINTLIFAGVCSLAQDPRTISEETLNQCLMLNINTINNFQEKETINLCSPLLQDLVTIDPMDAYMLRMVIANPNCNYLHIVEGLLTLNVQGVISINSQDDTVSEDQIIESATNLAQTFLENTLVTYKNLMLI